MHGAFARDLLCVKHLTYDLEPWWHTSQCGSMHLGYHNAGSPFWVVVQQYHVLHSSVIPGPRETLSLRDEDPEVCCVPETRQCCWVEVTVQDHKWPARNLEGLFVATEQKLPWKDVRDERIDSKFPNQDCNKVIKLQPNSDRTIYCCTGTCCSVYHDSLSSRMQPHTSFFFILDSELHC